MFIFKKIFSQFLFPLPLVAYLFLAALFLLWFTRHQKTGKGLMTIGVFIILLFSCKGVPNIFLKSLEDKYNVLDVTSLNDNDTLEKEQIELIVVLGGGHTLNPDYTITSQINNFSLVRLIEGIRIYREIPNSKLLLSGGGSIGTDAEIMLEVARAIGVDRNDIILESESMDTKDQAMFIKELVKESPFILVTSASHMPRSIALFRKQGMNPIPAPTGHKSITPQRSRFVLPFPKGKEIVKAETVFYEYLGLMWAKLRDQI